MDGNFPDPAYPEAQSVLEIETEILTGVDGREFRKNVKREFVSE